MSRTLPLSWAALVGLLAAAGVATSAAAQSAVPAFPASASAPTRMPSRADIDAARKLVPSAADIAAEIGRAAQEGGTRPIVQPIVRVPQAALDRERQSAPDLRGLAEQYERVRRGPDGETPAREASGLLVFVSLGMPRASLERLIEEARRVRAVLVLRGVKDRSLTRTAAAVSELVGRDGPAWQIDPVLFRRFEVAAVPSFVLIDPARPVPVGCGDVRCQPAAFAKLQGDVSIAHALGAIAEGDPKLAGTARVLSLRLRGATR